MKKGRFLWSAHRITERQKAGKARSIKGKQLKNSRSTVSRPPVVRLSSPSADFFRRSAKLPVRMGWQFFMHIRRSPLCTAGSGICPTAGFFRLGSEVKCDHHGEHRQKLLRGDMSRHCQICKYHRQDDRDQTLDCQQVGKPSFDEFHTAPPCRFPPVYAPAPLAVPAESVPPPSVWPEKIAVQSFPYMV